MGHPCLTIRKTTGAWTAIPSRSSKTKKVSTQSGHPLNPFQMAGTKSDPLAQSKTASIGSKKTGPISRQNHCAPLGTEHEGGICLNLCGATILSLELSGGIVVISKKHWSPESDVSVQGVKRRDSGVWHVSGVFAPRGIFPDCGLHSRRRHEWRQRRLRDLPEHGDKVTVALWICRWRCPASTCPRRTF